MPRVDFQLLYEVISAQSSFAMITCLATTVTGRIGAAKFALSLRELLALRRILLLPSSNRAPLTYQNAAFHHGPKNDWSSWYKVPTTSLGTKITDDNAANLQGK